MSDTIQAKAGPDADVLCTFDGDALEIIGYTSSVVTIPTAKVNVKRKKKPEKDGGQVIYIVSSLMTSRLELYFQPSELANMEQLVAALLAAGAQTI